VALLTVQNIRDYVRTFVDLDDTDVPDALVDSWTQEAYDDLVGLDPRWPWFEIGGQDSGNRYGITLVAGQQNYALPATTDQNNGAVATVNPKRLLAVQGQHWELRYVGQTALESVYVPQFLSFTNEPRYWSEWGNTGVTIWPLPNGAYNLNIRGYRDPVDFVSLGAGGILDGPPEFGTAIQQYVLSNTWSQQSDLQQSAYWMQNYMAARDRIHRNRVRSSLAEGVVLNGASRAASNVPPTLLFPFQSGPFD
jgi:hypothetical protein